MIEKSITTCKTSPTTNTPSKWSCQKLLHRSSHFFSVSHFQLLCSLFHLALSSLVDLVSPLSPGTNTLHSAVSWIQQQASNLCLCFSSLSPAPPCLFMIEACDCIIYSKSVKRLWKHFPGQNIWTKYLHSKYFSDSLWELGNKHKYAIYLIFLFLYLCNLRQEKKEAKFYLTAKPKVTHQWILNMFLQGAFLLYAMRHSNPVPKFHH